MKRWLAAVMVAGLVGVGRAAEGFTHTFGLGNGTVVVSNSQANSSWVAVAVMLQYARASSGTAQVARASQGVRVVLGWCAFTNVTSLVWVPESSYAFGYGDALVIGSTVTNGVVQVTRRGE